MEEQWLTGPEGTAFYTRLYRPTGALCSALVFVHGYDEHISRYEKMHLAWAARGVVVFAYDLRGFGRTALDTPKSPQSAYGEMGSPLADLDWAIKHTRSVCEGVPLFLMGHSMGGGIVMDYVTSKSGDCRSNAASFVSGVISSSPWIHLTNEIPTPVVWIFALINKIYPSMHFSTPVRPTAISHDISVGEALKKDPWVRELGTVGGIYAMLIMGMRLAKEGHKDWPKSLPLLLLHGTDDNMNSCPASEAFFNAISADNKKLIIYPDAFHDLMSEPDIKDKYREDCISWVEAHLPGARPNEATE
ncbi:lysophospholipase [Mycena galopus ATCC 62051]|nr:lysophospholipase [Mycena galopus ATCC 62051]